MVRKHPLYILFILLFLSQRAFSQQITFEQDTFDFGKFHFRPGMKQYLNFTNTGADSLRFLQVPISATGSEVAGMVGHKMVYAPGESGSIVYSIGNSIPGKYRKFVKVETNADPGVKVLPVQWEILPEVIFDNVLDRRFPNKDSIVRLFWQIERNGCYGRPPRADWQNNYTECSEIRDDLIGTFLKLFSTGELIKQACSNQNEFVRLVCLEALSRVGMPMENYETIFEAEYRRVCRMPANLGMEWSVYDRMLAIVDYYKSSPYPKSQKLDLPTFVFLSNLTQNSFYYQIEDSKSLVLIRPELNFGHIDLTDYSSADGSFELKGKIRVHNPTDKYVVVAPYHDGSTTCDKRSYQIPPNGQVQINYRSIVKAREMHQPIHRTIDIIDFVTKEKQVFTFRAEIERH